VPLGYEELDNHAADVSTAAGDKNVHAVPAKESGIGRT
jgi:hypothetical protein